LFSKVLPITLGWGHIEPLSTFNRLVQSENGV
jgi:hypothetical protein